MNTGKQKGAKVRQWCTGTSEERFLLHRASSKASGGMLGTQESWMKTGNENAVHTDKEA